MMTGQRAHGLSRRLEALARTITRFTYYARLATMAKRDVGLMPSHSVDEATTRHEKKHGRKNSGRTS